MHANINVNLNPFLRQFRGRVMTLVNDDSQVNIFKTYFISPWGPGVALKIYHFSKKQLLLTGFLVIKIQQKSRNYWFECTLCQPYQIFKKSRKKFKCLKISWLKIIELLSSCLCDNRIFNLRQSPLRHQR